MRVLGIETSCDETAVAVVENGPDGRRCLAHALSSQIADHTPFGGVVPEIAARSHLNRLDGLVDRAMKDSGLAYEDLDGIAATAFPVSSAG